MVAVGSVLSCNSGVWLCSLLVFSLSPLLTRVIWNFYRMWCYLLCSYVRWRISIKTTFSNRQCFQWLVTGILPQYSLYHGWSFVQNSAFSPDWAIKKNCFKSSFSVLNVSQSCVQGLWQIVCSSEWVSTVNPASLLRTSMCLGLAGIHPVCAINVGNFCGRQLRVRELCGRPWIRFTYLLKLYLTLHRQLSSAVSSPRTSGTPRGQSDPPKHPLWKWLSLPSGEKRDPNWHLHNLTSNSVGWVRPKVI